MVASWLLLMLAAPPEMAEVELTAERLLHDGKRDLTSGDGNATFRAEDAAVDADRIVYDRPNRVVTAVGHVVARLAQGGMVAVVGDVVTLRLDEEERIHEVFLQDGQALSKKDVGKQVFLSANTAALIEKVGTTQALLQGNHLVREGSKWAVDQLEIVPCECDFKNPVWSITSHSATVDTEADRVAMVSAVVRIKHIPILWLPWLSLPLKGRQSGLLMPRPGFAPQNAFSIDQPVFLALGRSADVTLSPGYVVGTSGQGTVGTPQGPTPLGVAGPRLSTEFRYAPSTRASGRVLLGLLYDLRDKRDVENPALRELGTQRGLRGELGWQHTQDFERGFGTRVDLNAHSDGDYNRDLVVDVIASSATYLRSTATLFHRGEDHHLGLDVGLRQDIQWGYDVFGRGTLLNTNRDPMANGSFGPGTLQRLPALTFGWSPTTSGPLRFNLEAESVRLAPLFSATGDEGEAANEGAVRAERFAQGVDALFSPSVSSPFGTVRKGVGDRLWQPGEREARNRLMVMPRLSVAAQPFGVLSTAAFAAWRQLGWLGEASGRTWLRGYLLLGGRLEAEASKAFGDGLRHVVQGLVEARAVAAGFEAASAPSATMPLALVPYDAIDGAVPDVSARLQSVVEVRQRLLRHGAELLRFDLGQGFEWGKQIATVGETYGRLGLRWNWFSAQGILRVDPLVNRLASDGKTLAEMAGITRMAGRVELGDGRHSAYVSYENLLMEGTARSRQPIDLLFQIDRGYLSATRVRQVTFGAYWDMGPVSLRYDALISDQNINGTPTLALTQQSAALGIAPACDCWRIDVMATQPTYPRPLFPQLGFNFSISRFGSIGSR